MNPQDEKLKRAYIEGIKEGIRAYAWWKDGTQYVGTTGTTLVKALEDASSGEYPLSWHIIDL